jgi:hypothetical protein
MDEIREQLRAYAQELRNSGVPMEEARGLLAERERSLRASASAAPAAQARSDAGRLSLGQSARLGAQGLTFGFGDELEALAKGAAAAIPGGRSPREAYGEALETSRGSIEKARQDAPLKALALEAAGGFLPAVATTPFTGGGSLAALGARVSSAAPRAYSIAQNVRRAGMASAARPVVGGGVEGAIYGAGAAEGGLPSRAAGAAMGGLTGAATGGVLSGAGAVGRRGYNLVEDINLQRDAKRIAEARRQRGRPSSEGEVFSSLAMARRPRSSAISAMTDVEQALLQQGVEPSSVSRFARPGQTIMELGSPRSEAAAVAAGMPQSSAAATPIQRVTRQVSVLGGEPGERVRSTIAERLMDSPDRVRAELTSRVAPGRVPYLEAADDLARERKSNANALYEQAYQQTIPVEKLTQFIQRSARTNWFADLYSKARGLAMQEVAEQVPGAKRLPRIFEKNDQGKIVIIPGREVPVKAADYIQRVMREEVESGYRGREANVQLARIRNQGVKNFLDVVDQEVPDFANARRVYKSDSAEIAAFDAALKGGEVEIGGRPFKMKSFVNERPEVVRRFLEDPLTSQSERQRYIEAALESLLQKTEQVAPGRDITRTIFSNEAMRNKVKLLLGTEDNFKEFVSAVLPERGLKSLEARALGGSSTMDKAVDIGLDRNRSGETAIAAATGATALAARIFAGVVDQAERTFTKAVRGRSQRAISSRLLTMEPKSFERYYENVHTPMLKDNLGTLGGFSQAARRTTSNQLARMFGGQF